MPRRSSSGISCFIFDSPGFTKATSPMPLTFARFSAFLTADMVPRVRDVWACRASLRADLYQGSASAVPLVPNRSWALAPGILRPSRKCLNERAEQRRSQSVQFDDGMRARG